MYKFLLLFVFLVLSNNIGAQVPVNYSEVALETEEDFKAAEPMVLHAADFILSAPADAKDMNRIYAIQLVMTWMQGAPGYEFDLEGIDYLGDDVLAKTAYIASVVKSRLENKEQSDNESSLNLEAWTTFLNYSEKNENNIKSTQEIRKLIAAKNNGTLEAELNKRNR